MTINQLPDPRRRGDYSIEEAIDSRRSVREFSDQALSSAEISQLVWAAQGMTDSAGLRSAPSAGALYPLEIYVATASGLYRYQPAQHQLTQCTEQDLRQEIHAAGLAQGSLIDAPVVFVITAVYARTRIKYGDRAERYAHMEAGHAAQNVLLQAVALELGGVLVGAFNDTQLTQILSLPSNESPLYLIPIGHPAETQLADVNRSK